MSVYRLLLRLYPSSFRAEYGDEMAAVHEERRRDSPGALSALALGIGAFFDILPNAARAHADLLRQDLRYAARTFRRSPGFASTAVVVAALGIGAATAAFSITDHVLIRPLPFPESDRLVTIWQDESSRGIRNELSPGNFRDWKSRSKSFERMAAYRGGAMNLVGEGRPEQLEGAVVTADLFPTLRARPALGRLFTADDDRPGANGTVVLSDRLWRGRFGADPDVLGRKVILNDSPYVVVGVMPRNFFFPVRDTELWTPLRLDEPDFKDRHDTYLRVIARLKPGISPEQARADMGVIAAQLERAFPRENAGLGVTIVRLRDEVSQQARLLLKALLGASIGVLLIACTNLANLLLARALSRRRELAVRTAMGAGRERLVRQLLTESLVLAACGGALGVLLAAAAGPLVARLIPNSLPIAETPPVDLRMLAFALLLTAATGIAFGVLPALRASTDADEDGLRENARSGSGRRTERLRSTLVVAEVTVSVALLIASGLLIRALWRLQSTDPGFRARGVLTLRTALPMPKYEKTLARNQFYDRVLTEARRLPGVSEAAYVSFLPMVARGGIWAITPDGQPENPEESRKASLRYVTPRYFAAMGIPLRRGRDVAASDTRESPFVAVVSESFARQLWPSENPLGRRFKFALSDRTVVGVVGDVRVRGLERSSEPQVYVPSTQVADSNIIGYVPRDLVIRLSVAPATVLPALREIVARADPQQPISSVRTLTEIVEGETAARSVQALLLGAFAAVALLLAAIGIHGVLAFAVSQRTREIGVRMALGAQAGEILRMVLNRGIVLAAAGVALGVVLAFAAGRAMQALLAGVNPSDVPTFLAAVALSLAMTMVGSLLPAIRAVRVNPMAAIRTE